MISLSSVSVCVCVLRAGFELEPLSVDKFARFKSTVFVKLAKPGWPNVIFDLKFEFEVPAI